MVVVDLFSSDVGDDDVTDCVSDFAKRDRFWRLFTVLIDVCARLGRV